MDSGQQMDRWFAIASDQAGGDHGRSRRCLPSPEPAGFRL